ncbi:hypothetical protein E2P81_ATG05181 [Venturia nashicola]|nr:hypothetical protein E2P81_ATG05181 [Venturia nashicola]
MRFTAIITALCFLVAGTAAGETPPILAAVPAALSILAVRTTTDNTPPKHDKPTVDKPKKSSPDLINGLQKNGPPPPKNHQLVSTTTAITASECHPPPSIDPKSRASSS